MNDIFIKMVPIILIFLLGYTLKRLGVLKREDGEILLKVVFYLSLPFLIIMSVARVDLHLNFIYLPIAATFIIMGTSVIAFWTGKLLQLPSPTLGAFLVGSTIMNIGFTLPFVIAAYGEDGLARISLFDFGNGLLTFTLVYYFACKYGTGAGKNKMLAKKLILWPLLWALLIAAILAVTRTAIPPII